MMPRVSIIIMSLPYFASGTVVRGLGRGSKQLGIPTANYPESVVDQLPSKFECGVYYGCARVDNGPVHKMVMSVGWNPQYKNEKKSMETHILHEFKEDFYGANLQVCVVGYIRPEKTFDSLDGLISEIKNDIATAEKLLDNEKFMQYSEHLLQNVYKNNDFQ